MRDDLRTRGIHILGELAKAWDEKAWSAVKAWERDCIAAYPSLEHLGPITPNERGWAEGLVLQRAPNFSLVHSSTYFLDDETIETTVFETGVRLYRLHHSNVKPRSKTGPTPINLDKQMSTAKHLRFIGASKLAAATRAVEEHGRGGCSSDAAAIDRVRQNI